MVNFQPTLYSLGVRGAVRRAELSQFHREILDLRRTGPSLDLQVGLILHASNGIGGNQAADSLRVGKDVVESDQSSRRRRDQMHRRQGEAFQQGV